MADWNGDAAYQRYNEEYIEQLDTRGTEYVELAHREY